MSLRRTMFTLFLSLSSTCLFASDLPPPTYSSAEHDAIGDSVKLYFSTNDPGQRASLLKLSNGFMLTYGDILAFGDMYGIPEEPISQGKTEADRKARFLAAFNTFAMNSSSMSEATQIILAFHHERQIVDDRMRQGEEPEVIYKDIDNEMGREYNCATGGGCSSVWWLKPGRYLTLADKNFDHFAPNAWLAYQAGHALAIEQALLAHNTQDKMQLQYAYELNAFASHFLSDRFSPGHLRVPREKLTSEVTPNTIGSLLAAYMHHEENFYGLHVHNLQGKHWIAYGDNSYFSAKNTEHRNLLLDALQLSANQILYAYLNGVAPADRPIEQMLPIPDELNNESNQDISPLFYWDTTSKKLMRRKDMSRVNDNHWTADWWGWSTLLELKNTRGLTAKDRALLTLIKK